MKLYGRLIIDTRIIKEAVVVKNSEDASFRDMLEACLVEVCRELDIGVPIWLKKNTKEFANHHWTSFTVEQFVEKISFDRFEIRIEQI